MVGGGVGFGVHYHWYSGNDQDRSYTHLNLQFGYDLANCLKVVKLSARTVPNGLLRGVTSVSSTKNDQVYPSVIVIMIT